MSFLVCCAQESLSQVAMVRLWHLLRDVFVLSARSAGLVNLSLVFLVLSARSAGLVNLSLVFLFLVK